jgi:hypothetical protein
VVHRHIGVAQEVIRRVAVADGRDADAGTDEDIVAVDDERPSKGGDDPVGDERTLDLVGRVLDENRELVAAQSPMLSLTVLK